MNDAAAVLIIDDDDGGRVAYRAVLERKGFHVVEAADGPAGIERAREGALGAVLLDLRMPGLDGLDVLDTLVREHPDTPVLVVSGRGTTGDVVQALRRGAWDFIQKPVVDTEFLVRAVARGVEKATLLRKNKEYGESLRRSNQRLSAALDELRADGAAARRLQFQLLPDDGLRLGPYVCSRRLFPSQALSGDFLDYFALGEHHLGFYLADVAGHGAASALITAILTTLVGKYREALSSRHDETILAPVPFLTRLDADLKPHRLERHVTLFYGVLELATGRVAYANAGAFPHPIVCNGRAAIELESAGQPLNLPGHVGFGAGETELLPEGRLLLASDGVLELEPKQSHRERRHALAHVLEATRTLDGVLDALALDATTPLRDDVAFLFLRREESHA